MLHSTVITAGVLVVAIFVLFFVALFSHTMFTGGDDALLYFATKNLIIKILH